MHIPWGAILLIGGLVWVYATEFPEVVGWVAFGIGLFLTIIQFIAILFVFGVIGVAAKQAAKDNLTYTTNRGRKLPRR